MIERRNLLVALLAGIGLATTAVQAQPASVLVPADQLPWASGGIAGVSTAALPGGSDAGGYHFFLRYAAGLVTPLHYHSADHFVSTVSGRLVLVVDGVEQRLGPGSYFALTGRKPHAARCEAGADCVMFVDSRARWDVVPVAPK